MIRRLVIDACVGAAAGDGQSVRSASCRATLDAIRTNQSFHAVLTKSLEREWQSHLSRFSRLWLISMRSARRVIRISEDGDVRLLIDIQHACSTDEIRAILTKDFHLIHASVSTDRVLVTIDHTCVFHFRRVSLQVAEIVSVTVADPERHSDEVLRWLAAGAPAVPRWQLGHPE